ncbi:DUF2892 domain-containing protein [Candidatus Woesearchaeota archaeon]|nr:DUF2892 domain-containing protein [Candidatus Woesearchaeota archaeon]
MKKNVGKTDKAVRFIMGLIFLYLGFAYSAWWYIIAAIAFVTSFTSFCGLYKLLKINTIKK